MRYDVVYSKRFLRELKAAGTYISKELCNPTAASALLDEVEKKANALKDFPFTGSLCGQPLSDFGYRKLIVKNYIAVYKVEESDRRVILRRFIYARADYLNKL